MIERETVVRWLEDAELETTDVEIEEDEPFAWALSFQSSIFHTLVAHHPVEWNNLLMQVTIGVAEEHIDALRNVSGDDRERFLHDLRITLLQRPIGYRINLVEDEDTPIPASITFVLNVMEDPLQRSGFFRRNHQLQSSALLAAEMFKKLTRFEQWS